MIRVGMLLICLGASIWPTSLAVAADPSWFAQPDLMQLVIGLLFAYFIWSIARTLNKVDKNQTVLFTKISNIEKDFYELRGEHKANGFHVHHRESDQ